MGMYDIPYGPPEISDERLDYWDAMLNPLVVDGNTNNIYTILRPADLRNTAFIWQAKRVKRVHITGVVHGCAMVHDFGAPSFFKPSIAEVLAQVPRYIDDDRLWKQYATEGKLSGYFLEAAGFHSARDNEYPDPAYAPPGFKAGDWHKSWCTFVTYEEIEDAEPSDKVG